MTDGADTGTTVSSCLTGAVMRKGEPMRYVHNNKCDGGHAFEEVDRKTYCLGRVDAAFEDKVFVDECKKCPRLLDNNEDKIYEYIKRMERRAANDK
jgi:hypothetical protein